MKTFMAMDTFRHSKAPVLSFGIIIFSVGIIFLIMHWETQSNGVRTMGIVTDVVEHADIDSSGNTTYSYNVSLYYVTRPGDTIRGSLYARARYQYSVGEPLELVYKKDKPSRFYRAKSALYYFVYGGIATIGALIIFLSSKMKSEKWDEV